MAQLAGEIVAVSLPAPRSLALPSLPRWRVVLWLAALTALVGLAAASYLAYTGNMATTNYNIQRMRDERREWQLRNQQLRLELAKVQSLTFIEHEAVSRLGMQRPANLTYVKVESTAQQDAIPQSTVRTRP